MYDCIECGKVFDKEPYLKDHYKTARHLFIASLPWYIKYSPEFTADRKYYCCVCDKHTPDKTKIQRHCRTAKHRKRIATLNDFFIRKVDKETWYCSLCQQSMNLSRAANHIHVGKL